VGTALADFPRTGRSGTAAQDVVNQKRPREERRREILLVGIITAIKKKILHLLKGVGCNESSLKYIQT